MSAKAYVSTRKKGQRSYLRFLLPEVPSPESEGEETLEPFFVCHNAFLTIHNCGWYKYKTFKKCVETSTVKIHKLSGRRANNSLSERFLSCMVALQVFFQDLESEAEQT